MKLIICISSLACSSMFLLMNLQLANPNMEIFRSQTEGVSGFALPGGKIICFSPPWVCFLMKASQL